MAKASLLPQGLTPKYQNFSPLAQEISSGEMSEVLKKVKKGQVVRLDVDSRSDSSCVMAEQCIMCFCYESLEYNWKT